MAGQDPFGIHEARERLWAFLKAEAEAGLDSSRNFTAEAVFGNANRPGPDALWEMAIAGVLRQGGSSYWLTQQGWQILREDVSPYEGDPFVIAVERGASMLDHGAKGYLELALRCVMAVPQASVALLRVAMELEVDSIIEQALVSWAPPPNTRRKLGHRNVSERSRCLIEQLAPGGRSVQTQEENDLFKGFIDHIRVSGNRIVHPSTMRPSIDVLQVQALFYAYREFASISTSVKQGL